MINFSSLPLGGGSAGKAGVGWPRQFPQNAIHCPVQRLVNVDIPKAQNLETAPRKFCITQAISFNMGAHAVLAAIDFDDEPMGFLGEVDDVGGNRAMPAEMKAFHLQAAQIDPEFTSCGVMRLRRVLAISLAIFPHPRCSATAPSPRRGGMANVAEVKTANSGDSVAHSRKAET